MATGRHPRTRSGLGQTAPINTLPGRHPRTSSQLGAPTLQPDTEDGFTTHPRSMSTSTRMEMLINQQEAAGDVPTAASLLLPKLDVQRRGRVRHSRPVQGRVKPSALLGVGR